MIHQSEMKTTILTVIIAIISLIIFLPMAFTYTIFLVKANMSSPSISVRSDDLNINLLVYWCPRRQLDGVSQKFAKTTSILHVVTKFLQILIVNLLITLTYSVLTGLVITFRSHNHFLNIVKIICNLIKFILT